MKQSSKRHIVSWLLLSVFVPMLLLSSVHIHSGWAEDAAQCDECVRHQCHGHIAIEKIAADDCVLCQFLMLCFTAAATLVVVLGNTKASKRIVENNSSVFLSVRGLMMLRAPPVVSV